MRYLEIVELKDLNVRIKENVINKQDETRGFNMCIHILVIRRRRCGARPRLSSSIAASRGAHSDASLNFHQRQTMFLTGLVLETFLPHGDSMRQLLAIKRPVSGMPIPDGTYRCSLYLEQGNVFSNLTGRSSSHIRILMAFSPTAP